MRLPRRKCSLVANHGAALWMSDQWHGLSPRPGRSATGHRVDRDRRVHARRPGPFGMEDFDPHRRRNFTRRRHAPDGTGTRSSCAGCPPAGRAPSGCWRHWCWRPSRGHVHVQHGGGEPVPALGISSAALAGPEGRLHPIQAVMSVALASMSISLPISTPPNALAYGRGEFTTRE